MRPASLERRASRKPAESPQDALEMIFDRVSPSNEPWALVRRAADLEKSGNAKLRAKQARPKRTSTVATSCRRSISSSGHLASYDAAISGQGRLRRTYSNRGLALVGSSDGTRRWTSFDRAVGISRILREAHSIAANVLTAPTNGRRRRRATNSSCVNLILRMPTSTRRT